MLWLYSVLGFREKHTLLRFYDVQGFWLSCGHILLRVIGRVTSLVCWGGDKHWFLGCWQIRLMVRTHYATMNKQWRGSFFSIFGHPRSACLWFSVHALVPVFPCFSTCWRWPYSAAKRKRAHIILLGRGCSIVWPVVPLVYNTSWHTHTHTHTHFFASTSPPVWARGAQAPTVRCHGRGRPFGRA